MSLVINTNVAALNSQRQLMNSGTALDRATERLSSGQRINSAKDDAAGLAISNRMTSQVRGLDQAIRNSNDGVSLIQTAEGALQESTNILQRMRELSIQAANGIYSDADRKTLDAEVKQLVSELNRIALSTSFNGQKLLDGTLGKVDLQVGADAGQTITMKIPSMDAKTLGMGSSSADIASTHFSGAIGSTTLNDGDVLINGKSFGAVTSTTNLDTLLDQINTSIEGVKATAFNAVTGSALGTGITTSTATAEITVTDPDGSVSVFTVSGTGNLDEFIDAVNTITNGKVTASKTEGGLLVLANSNGAQIDLAGTGTFSDITGISTANNYGQLALTSTTGGEITVTKGTNGTTAKLASLGFQELRARGTVLAGSALNTTALASGDLKINGTTIDHKNTGTLQGKVDNINAVSETTGVIAALKSEQVGDFDLARTAAEINLGTGTGTAFATGDSFYINGVSVVTTASGITGLAASIEANYASTGVHAYLDASAQLHLYSANPITIAAGTVNAGAIQTFMGLANGTTAVTAASSGSININNTNVTFSAFSDVNVVLTKINAAQATTGVFAALNDSGDIVLSSNAAFTVRAGASNGAKTLYTLGLMGSDNDPTDIETFSPSLELTSLRGNPISIEVTAAGATNTGLSAQNMPSSGASYGSSIDSLSIATQAGAVKAINVIDNALDTINDARSQLGAISNRLEFTVNNLANVSEKTSAARSRIVDADFASETAALSRAQVLQQAATAMLGQANARPQQVLSLLRQ